MDNFCLGRPEEERGWGHCYHPDPDDETNMVCCWCGGCFHSDVQTNVEHGEFRPISRSVRR